ncbi:hypothetical protein QE152_g34151 [Popillia japonica]|uniref:Uncharacterized protein n=1 Tax=Popillia japonica TaxID=7064 RepID=A0AAW1IUZ8_POPJA
MYLCVILRKGDTIGVDDSTLHPSAPMSASASRPYGTLKMGHTDSYFRRGLSNAVLMNTKNFIRDVPDSGTDKTRLGTGIKRGVERERGLKRYSACRSTYRAPVEQGYLHPLDRSRVTWTPAAMIASMFEQLGPKGQRHVVRKGSLLIVFGIV